MVRFLCSIWDRNTENMSKKMALIVFCLASVFLPSGHGQTLIDILNGIGGPPADNQQPSQQQSLSLFGLSPADNQQSSQQQSSSLFGPPPADNQQSSQQQSSSLFGLPPADNQQSSQQQSSSLFGLPPADNQQSSQQQSSSLFGLPPADNQQSSQQQSSSLFGLPATDNQQSSQQQSPSLFGLLPADNQQSSQQQSPSLQELLTQGQPQQQLSQLPPQGQPQFSQSLLPHQQPQQFLQQLPQHLRSQQQFSQQQQPSSGTTFHLDALPNTVDERSMGIGTSDHSSPLMHSLLGDSGSAGESLSQTTATRGSCTSREKRMLFSKCARAFGMAHIAQLSMMSLQPTCQSKVFDCRKVDRMIRCTNSLSERVISNKCWPAVDDVLTDFLHTYGAPCSYKNLIENCRTTSANLLTLDQRQDQSFMKRRRPKKRNFLLQLMMMSLMGMGGGLSGLFGGM